MKTPRGIDMETIQLGQVVSGLETERKEASALVLHGDLEGASRRISGILERLRTAHNMGGLDAATLRMHRAHCYREQGNIENKRGNGIAAEALFRKASALFGMLGQDGYQAEVQRALAHLAAENNRLAMAQRWYEAAGKSFQQAGKPAQAGLMRLQVLHNRCLLHAQKDGLRSAAATEIQTGLHPQNASAEALAAMDAVREAMILSIHAVEKHGRYEQRIHAQALAEHICRLTGDGEAVVWHMAQRLHLLELENGALRSAVAMAEAEQSASIDADAPQLAAGIDASASQAGQTAATPQDSASPEREAMRSFIHKAAHDMKEPLRMIAGFGGLMQRRYATALEDDGMEYLETVLDAGKRMQELLDKLLVHAQIGTDDAGSGQVPLSDIVNGILEENRQNWTVKGLAVDCQIQGHWPGAADHWKAAMEELIDNAIRFNASDAPSICVKGYREKGSLVVSVSDNGIGIEPKFQKEVFQLFRRLHSRSEYRGSGIGLAIVARVAELYGGDCRCSTLPEGGTCIELRIPAQTAALPGTAQDRRGQDATPAA